MTVRTLWRTGKDFPAPARKNLQKLIAAIAGQACPGVTRIAATFLNPEEMAEVNMQSLGHSGPTDVICFDYRDSGMPFDDSDDEPQVELFLCPAVALREAEKRDLPYSGELTLYLVHGLLHAGGYDDLRPDLKRKMRAAERRVRAALPDGYETFFPDPVPCHE